MAMRVDQPIDVARHQHAGLAQPTDPGQRRRLVDSLGQRQQPDAANQRQPRVDLEFDAPAMDRLDALRRQPAEQVQRRRISKFFRRSQTAATIKRMNSGEREGGDTHGGDTPPLQPKQRLKRLGRLFTSYPLYFITACTEDRKPILANAKVREDFRKFCETGLTRGVFVGKYVVMPDHLHLFVAFGEEYETALVEARSRRSQTGATGGTH